MAVNIRNMSGYLTNVSGGPYHWDLYNGSDVATTAVAMAMNDTDVRYPGTKVLQEIGDWYRNYHGYIAAVVCAFGIVANILNIVVLTRKNMISATNCILTGLAVSDGLTMVAYLPYALRFYCLYGTAATVERNTLGSARFLLFYACFSVVVHTVSIWLTVTLAVFRYIFIRYPRHGAVMCTLFRAKISVFLVFVVTLFVCIPNFVTIRVTADEVPPENHTETNGNATAVQLLWYVNFKRGTESERMLYQFNFWVQALFVKIVPCIWLTVLSFLLVRTMKEAEQRRINLRAGNTVRDDSSRDRKSARTTRMLLAVVIMFLVTEFPQGILSLLSGTLPSFERDVYVNLGELMDILALISNGVNFILYCSMSKQFRDTFIAIFLNPIKKDQHSEFTLVPQATKTEL